jgi:transposase-like protein
MEYDRNQLSCRNTKCPDYGKVGAGNIGIHCRKDHRFYCTTCKARFSAREGTLFYNLKTDPAKVMITLKALSERNSIRGTSRIVGVGANSVMRWLRRTGRRANELSDQMIKDLDVSQAQFDEVWGFVGKKR